jgi:hypothetical protein
LDAVKTYSVGSLKAEMYCLISNSNYTKITLFNNKPHTSGEMNLRGYNCLYFTQQRPEFNVRVIHVEFIQTSCHWQRLFSEYFELPLPIINPPMLLHHHHHHHGLVQQAPFETSV